MRTATTGNGKGGKSKAGKGGNDRGYSDDVSLGVMTANGSLGLSAVSSSGSEKSKDKSVKR